MKKIIKILSYVGIAVATAVLIILYASTIPAPSETATNTVSDIAPNKNTVTFENFTLNQSQRINFQENQATFNRLTQREQQDQQRDWLLLTTVSHLGLSADQLNQSLYDFSPIRYGYMKPVSNFQYGKTRSTYIGNGEIVALLPQGLSPEEQKDELAHIADYHRQNLGEIPKEIQIFEYELNPTENNATLTRRKSVNAEKIFSKKDYGYVEAEIQTLEDLNQLMSRIDDITFAEVKSAKLLVGGRKIYSREYRGIQVEDIAAIWQSEKKIQTQLAEFQSRWDNKLSNAPILQRPSLIEQAKQEREKLQLVSGSGFSLDPKYDYQRLQETLSKGKSLFQSLIDLSLITPDDFQKVEKGLAEKNVVPYLEVIEKLTQSQDLRAILYAQILSEANQQAQFLTARYDGDLQGTEVGMVLFYTDLLAKLWAIDYLGTTPQQFIEDFKPLTQVKISSIYQKELEELSYTRLWFGPQDKGFQVINQGDQILFARNATRIYAASSNPLKPGEETTASAASEAFLGWWNEHYEEVARYEPEYERLNQIMKWSLLISWLNQYNQGERLGFLQTVQVQREHWFSDWVWENIEQLKFKQWEQIPFYQRGYLGTKTEALPALSSEAFTQFGQSRILSGGVSLADQQLFKGRRPLQRTGDISPLSLRSNLDYGSVQSNPTGKSFKTWEGVSYQLNRSTPDLAFVKAQAKTGAKLRSPEAELINQSFTRKISRTNSDVEINVELEGRQVGRFKTEKIGNAFTVGWQSRDIDAGHNLALELSRVSPREIGNVLRNNLSVESAVYLPNDSGYYIKMYNSDSWLKLSSGGGGNSNIPPGWQSRVGDPDAGGGAGNSNIPPKNSSRVGDPDVSVGGGGNNIIPPDSPYVFRDWDDFNGDRNYLVAWVDEDTVKTDVAEGKAEPLFDKAKQPAARQFVDNFQRQPYQETAQKIVDNPKKASQYVNLRFEDNLNRIYDYIKAGKFEEAERYIYEAVDIYGYRPELMFDLAVTEIGLRKVKVKQIQPNQVIEGEFVRADFLNEVTGRMQPRKKIKVIETKDNVIYIADSPGFNNIDWSVPIEDNIPLMSGKRRVYRVEEGDIGDAGLGGFDDGGGSLPPGGNGEPSGSEQPADPSVETSRPYRTIRSYPRFYQEQQCRNNSEKNGESKVSDDDNSEQNKEREMSKNCRTKSTYLVIESSEE